MEPENNFDERTKRRALKSVLEWMTSEEYAERANWKTVYQTWTVWKEDNAIDKSEKRTEEELQKERTLEETKDAVKKLGWFKFDYATIGRPRTRDFSAKQERAAQRREEQYGWVVSERAAKDLRRVAGESQRENLWVVTLTENVWRDLLKQTDPATLEGRTRDELTTQLKLTRKVTNSFIRYLLSNGWRESKVRTPDGRKNVLKRDEA